MFFFSCSGDHRALHVLTHSFPTRRSSDLLKRNRLLQRAADATGAYEGGKVDLSGLDDPRLGDLVTPEAAAHRREEAELAVAGYAEFDAAAYRHGDLTPVYFGSALKDFGVEQLIDALAEFAPPPREQPASPHPVAPDDPAVSGFIFKVQANMNPQHRDRIAFMRLCSGKFKRGMKLTQVQTGKTIAVHSPIFRSEEHTSELQSLMRISYAVFCLKKHKN